MLKLEKKQIKIVSILIAVIFIGSVVAIALTQTGNIASAASSSSVGVIDYQQALAAHPDVQNLQGQMETVINDIKKEFDEKSAGMNDQEKADYYRQCQERIAQRQQELVEPIRQSVDTAIKKVADKKGIAVVIDKMAVVYGGQEITADVIAELGKK
ncbi:MAG: OmpH family outer membrane protein [Selenomonadaceae bacterium]|nr:OmpH family outer membrane protein [Selenomonadaceae bacterium]MBQ7723800.1 OmpH family outer membrane protein [Selenomonadaceae bacterium]